MSKTNKWLLFVGVLIFIVLVLLISYVLINQSNLFKTDQSKQENSSRQEWLQNIISQDEGKNEESQIMKCIYNNETVYYYSPGCCDQFSVLYSKEGEELCAPGGGLDGKGDGKCPKFNMQTCDPYWENEKLTNIENEVVDKEVVDEENTQLIKGYIKSVNETSITIDEVEMLTSDEAINACIGEGYCDSGCLANDTCLDTDYYISDTSKAETQYDLVANCIYTLIDYSFESMQNREVMHDDFLAQYNNAVQNNQNPLYEFVITSGMVTSINEVYIP